MGEVMTLWHINETIRPDPLTSNPGETPQHRYDPGKEWESFRKRPAFGFGRSDATAKDRDKPLPPAQVDVAAAANARAGSGMDAEKKPPPPPVADASIAAAVNMTAQIASN